LVEFEVDLAVAGKHAEVLRVALDDLTAVLERPPEFAGEEIRRGALVPGFGKVGFELDDAGKGGDRLG
jgi:hypothetical protein